MATQTLNIYTLVKKPLDEFSTSILPLGCKFDAIENVSKCYLWYCYYWLVSIEILHKSVCSII